MTERQPITGEWWDEGLNCWRPLPAYGAELYELRAALADPRISINHLPACYYVKNLTGRPETCDCGRDAFRAEVAKLLGR